MVGSATGSVVSSEQTVPTSLYPARKPVAEKQDHFIIRQQRVNQQLKIIKESDQEKFLNELNNLKPKPGTLTNLTTSSLLPVQNYTSTDDHVYKEAIEKRKIREAIGKYSHSQKHAPVSSVERKKH